MPATSLTSYTTVFDKVRQDDEFGENWSARDLMPVYGYTTWRQFRRAIDQAKVACAATGNPVSSNFAEASKITKSRHRIEDFRLTRYAAYLIAMEGDPSKPEIAAAKTYFAVQTRKAEIVIDSLDQDLQLMIEQLHQIQNLRNEQQAHRRRLDLHDAAILEQQHKMLAHSEYMEDVATRSGEALKVATEAVQSIQDLKDRVGSVEQTLPLTDTTELYSGKEAAQLLGYGIVNFYRILRNLSVIYPDRQRNGGHKIYQDKMDQGWGEAKWEQWGNRKGYSWTPYFTQKGIDKIRELIIKSDI